MGNLTYEIKENGYVILNEGKPWITQLEPYIPVKELSYEENALKQIEDIRKGQEDSIQENVTLETLKARIEEQELALIELANLISGGV